MMEMVKVVGVKWSDDVEEVKMRRMMIVGGLWIG